MTERPYQNATIGDMHDRAHDGWLWVSCPLPCNNRIAIPTEYFVKLYGADRPAEMIFETLRCGRCKGHPSLFTMPSYAGNPNDPGRLAPVPWDKVPEAIKAALSVHHQPISGLGQNTYEDENSHQDGHSGE